MSSINLFASCPRGVEPLLAAELAALGATALKERPGGVACSGELRSAYAACLWSRVASRVLMPLSTFPLSGADALYEAARALDWPALFDVDRSFAVEVAGHSPAVTHTHFAGLKVKDSIADAFRAAAGRRPDVDTERPDLRIHLHLQRESATLSLDLSGDSLHRRGYRAASVEAPLKENLACAILLRAGWPELVAQGAPLLDPMCGSGTLVIEAAMMAADVAPALMRERFGFEHWRGHQSALWRELLDEARARRERGLAQLKSRFFGRDLDARALKAARGNAVHAGVGEFIEWQQGDACEALPPPGGAGLVVVNPPYGERLGAESEVIKLYSLLGAQLKAQFGGWHAAVFTARPDLAPRLGLRASRLYSLYNGALPCKLLNFEIAGRVVEGTPAASAAEGEAFANRLRKNAKHLAKWARRKGVSSYRVYDADLPEYALAIDLYQSTELHAYVQEYAAPKSVDPVRAEKRLREALAQIGQVLEVPAARLHFRIRQAQKGGAQYGKQDAREHFETIEEHGCRLQVNFHDYLDTGLFLDHRALRLRIQQEASGKRFLNLFCYTGSATAHAARGGARETLSVDLSNTYLEWAQRNLLLNDVHSAVLARPGPITSKHTLLRADCRAWLRTAAEGAKPPQFDLIFCDPPTFSTSKKMEGVLDIQRDHVELISNCLRLLTADGTLYFSTNRRGFKLDGAALSGAAIEDITAQTLDEDFRRPPPPHRCWMIRRSE